MIFLGLVSSDVSEEPTVSVSGVTEFGSVSFSCCLSDGREVAIAGIEGSNTTKNMDVCLWCVGSGLCDERIARSQESNWVCVSKCVWSRTVHNEAS